MSVIETKDIYKIYNPDTIPVHACDGVSVNIERGEFTAVVGPSGSGKTTLLNIIGGLDTPTKGKVTVNGIDVTDLSSEQLIEFRKENIGFVFQSYNLIPVLTAKENIEFVMLLQGKSNKERNDRVMELIRAVGLDGKENNRPSQLSGGQQQRVAVARALASKPAFVLADEPTANLDSTSTNQLLDIMEGLNKEEGITFLFSTHDQRVIDRARRVITIEDGKVVKDEVR
ncbi:ABC transporter ATP-binding protein [Flavobacteriales bacterium]|jgi:putative ABC transport system ATP-binding protein|nr:ABC transporter ATP-binding protein [Flavobacteriales bacterium]